MNKKTLGSSIRRGVLTGTVAGFVAGWTAFVGHAKQVDAAQQDAWQEVDQKKTDVLLPAVPAIPDLGAEPGAASYRVGYGPSGPLPRVTSGGGAAPAPANPAAPAAPAPQGAAPAAPVAPPPAFAPLPALPPAPAAPAPVTQPTPKKP